MRKLGIGIFAVSFCFTLVFGVPKMQEMTHLKTECSELRKSNSENQSELDNIQEQIDAEKDTINSIRKTKSSPYDLKEVSKNLQKIKGVKIESADAYNSSDESGNVLVKTFKNPKGLAKLTSDVNLLDYKLKIDDVDKTVSAINALKLNVTSMSIDKAGKKIDLSVKFIGGDE